MQHSTSSSQQSSTEQARFHGDRRQKNIRNSDLAVFSYSLKLEKIGGSDD